MAGQHGFSQPLIHKEKQHHNYNMFNFLKDKLVPGQKSTKIMSEETVNRCFYRSNPWVWLIGETYREKSYHVDRPL